MSQKRPRPAAAKRGYSRAFTPANGAGKQYLVDAIPPGLWRRVKAKAKRDGRSIRHIALTALVAYLADEDDQ